MNATTAAVETFASRLSHVSLAVLALAVALHLANLLLRATAWRTTLAAALPLRSFRWRGVTGAYVAGAGVNSVVPARGGDVARVVLASRLAPGCCCVTVASTLLVETLLDAAVGTSLAAWAVSSGAVPAGLVALRPPGGPVVTVAAGVLAALASTLVAGRARARARLVAREFQLGVAILSSPRAYARGVAAPQGLAWAARLASIYCFLQAFHIDADVGQAALVLLAGSLATVMPFTPGGVGAQQALLVVLLSGIASPAAAVSYSLGTQFVTTVVNVALGGTCAGLMVGRMPWRARLATAEPPSLPAATSGE
ncbi:MAG TPA: lysylphosphatidylglycerol synthase transmembrane domain-containing protein [Gaiellales bacterium]